MLDTPEAVFEALRENHERPYGLQRSVTAEELVEAAEAFEKPDVLVTALLELMSAYEYTGEHRKAPVVFARLLKLWDTTPESFSEWEAHHVFWNFKWVTTSLLQVPEVPLATVQGWTDRMRERYEAAGHGVQPVAAMRYHIAAHTGVGIEDAYDLWATWPRTKLSDCEACETRHFASHLVRTGDDKAALDAWGPVFDRSQSCSEEPKTSQARALLPLLRTGRLDEARSFHLAGYRQVRGNTGTQNEVGLHLEFCALSRNEGRGLEILAENRPLFSSDGAPLDHLDFLTGVEVLLARLDEDGHAGTAVAGPAGREWTAGTLLAHVRAEADRLAAAFDARNGTGTIGDRRRERLARRPLLDEPLPLGLRATLARTAGTPAPASAPAPALATVTTVPDDFVTLVHEARRLDLEGHPGADRLWIRIGERLADSTAPDPVPYGDELGPEERLRAELAEHEAFRNGMTDRHHEGLAWLNRAAGLYERAGMPWHALSARTRGLAWGTYQGGESENANANANANANEAEGGAGNRTDTAEDIRAGLDALLRDAERLTTEAPFTGENAGAGEAAFGADLGKARAVEYLTVLNARAYAAFQEAMTEEPEPSDASLARAEEYTRTLRTEAERLNLPHQVANARQYAADMAGRGGDLDRAEAELRAALGDVAAAGRPWRGSRPRAQLARLLMAKDQPAEAAELLHQAIADAVRHDDTEFPLAPTYAMLGHAASHLGDFGGAVRHLSEAAARFDQAGEPDDATDARLQLADVLARSGQQADAVAVLESVLSGAQDETAPAPDDRLLAQVRLTLARGLRDLEEYLPAAEEFLRLADTVAGWEDDRHIHTMVAADAAVALAMADRWEAADTAYARAVAAHDEAPNWPRIAEMAREFARLTMMSRDTEGLDTALEHLTRADAVLAVVPEDTTDFAHWYETGQVHYRRARVLAGADRHSEALAEAEAAVAAYERGGENGGFPRAEATRIAALIEGNGLERLNDAITRLTGEIARCRAAGMEEAAGILDALRQDYLSR
ncbi:tetratricopeptide repeat protein [Streptomyces laurentii]|uniref:tetratricopeptide repeat protein n=1 Tax=Streptomyces laurentii TaxID=39478 RepID=UPI0036BB5B8A